MDFFILFSIIFSGIIVGKIKILNFSFDLSAILFTALAAGHFGLTLSPVYKNLGLALFIFSIGFEAGPNFKGGMRKSIMVSAFFAILITSTGFFTVLAAMKILKFPADLAAGIFNGALTSTPGLAAAIESTGNSPLSSIGYGVTYPFGVIGVIIAVNILFIFNKNGNTQNYGMKTPVKTETKSDFTFLIFLYSAGICIGAALGKINIPFFNFNFGLTGGILLAAIAAGKLYSLKIAFSPSFLQSNSVLRKTGLILFLAAAGTEAGNSFVDAVVKYGIAIFITGMITTIMPIITACLAGRLFFKTDILHLAGIITGGMTSSPGLAAVDSKCSSSVPGVSYSIIYPFALTAMIIFTRIIAGLN